MVAELAKCGVVARELPDGLEIEGSGLLGPPPAAGAADGAAPRGSLSLLRGAPIHCYDDHRIAMSFAALGLCVPAAAPRMVLDDQK